MHEYSQIFDIACTSNSLWFWQEEEIYFADINTYSLDLFLLGQLQEVHLSNIECTWPGQAVKPWHLKNGYWLSFITTHHQGGH